MHSLIVAFALLTLVLAGCAPLSEESSVTVPPEAKARALLDNGQYQEAAEEYTRLAESATGSAALDLGLTAAEIFYYGGHFAEAQAMLSTFESKDTSAEQNARATLIRTRIAFDIGKKDQALALARKLDIGLLPQKIAKEVRELRAKLYYDQGDYLFAAQERVAMGELLNAPSAIERNQRVIWNALGKTTAVVLAEKVSDTTGTFKGWLELALISKRLTDYPPKLMEKMRSWSAHYPEHPANQIIVPELVAQIEKVDETFRHLGLILPLYGSFSEPAHAIRDGFIFAWFLDKNPQRPPISVFDSTDRDVKTVFTEAVGSGVDLMIGPLRKDAVNEIENWPERPLTVLTLNHSSSRGLEHTIPSTELRFTLNGKKPIYQFALDPETEAVQVAEQAWIKGFTRALILAPENAWGERVVRAFASVWEDLGGVILSSQTYPNEIHKMAEPIKMLLNITASEQRKKHLQTIIATEIEHEPRRRQDADFIFLAAFPQLARSLKPQIDFFRGSDLPVYSTSHIFTGFPDSKTDQDIENVIFPDMPWVLSNRERVQILKGRIASARPRLSVQYNRFYAFGVDAYLLASNLNRLANSPTKGLDATTGWLTIGLNGVVKRYLLWAQIKHGIPKLLNSEPFTVEPF